MLEKYLSPKKIFVINSTHTLPAWNLSEMPCQKGVARYSMMGLMPTRNPVWKASIAMPLKKMEKRGKREPKAPKKQK